MRFFLSIVALLCGSIVLATAQSSSRPQDLTTTTVQESLHRAQRSAAVLQRSYVRQTGLYQTTGWWNSANAINALSDLMRADHSHTYVKTLANTLKQAQIPIPKPRRVGKLAEMTGFPGFLNNFYDDEGWWALAWINAYDLTHDERYLTAAQSIFADMAGGWDNTCGGGIWWSKDRNYKNAIANELFFSVAAHLATRGTPDRQAKAADWAQKDWEWFQASGMINTDHLINDGLIIDPATGSCRNNEKTTWTYNQGVILDALAEWSRVKSDTAILHDAQQIADAALTHLTDQAGILHDPCEPDHCGTDAPQFKGIFVRNLQSMNATLHEPRYRTFLQRNADSVWSTDRTAQDQLGLVWSGPPVAINAATQSSALDLLIAATAN